MQEGRVEERAWEGCFHKNPGFHHEVHEVAQRPRMRSESPAKAQGLYFMVFVYFVVKDAFAIGSWVRRLAGEFHRDAHLHDPGLVGLGHDLRDRPVRHGAVRVDHDEGAGLLLH